ncbi:restriction endonuclease subunit S [Paraburkholderia sp. UYCP14C]|uniref:restriction endonuclease subunit S n=1 Tax=Paraburkholderia sp. UYCP14C TaxID=2511130 RepID=UPI0010202692|nr:restriction endonuclease subunit S [Paraburkholderia sp. UYCP14C]RZF24013.1 restriction endonuclease subunit S [Paraburkholderia sp. UYCP14C]
MKLSEGFQLLATASDGVPLLRELVLSLAVRGKLVPQDSREEPASALLEKMNAERESAIRDGRLRRGKVASVVGSSLFKLPAGWQWARLGQVGDWGAGATPARSNPEYYGGGIPWFKSGELRSDYVSRSEETITQAALNDCSLRLNKAGDVLVAMYGATIGKTAILSSPATTNQAVCACTPFTGLDSRYLLLLLRSMRSYFIGLGAGGAQPNISREKIIASVIALPPAAEQVRIIAKVDELMKLCDELETHGRLESEQHARLTAALFDPLAASESAHALAENWARVAAHFDLLLDRPEAVDALERAIGRMAVRGLLVPQDPADTPARALLAEIQSRKARLIAEGKIKREKELPVISDDDAPFELPAGWTWARFPELGEFGRGKSKHRPRNDPTLFSPGVYPLIQTGDVARADRVIERFNAQYSESGLAQSKLWPAGTLCITIAANIADSAILGFDACFPDSVVGFVPIGELVDGRYLLTFIETAKDDLTAFAPSTAQKNINLEILNNVLIPVPPRNEMLRIVSRVEELRNLCGALRARLTAGQTCQARFSEAMVEQVAASQEDKGEFAAAA